MRYLEIKELEYNDERPLIKRITATNWIDTQRTSYKELKEFMHKHPILKIAEFKKGWIRLEEGYS